MNHHIRIVDLAIASLLQRRARTLVIVVVYSALVCLLGSLLLFVRGLRHEAHALLESSPEIVVQRLRGGRLQLMPVERVDGIAAIKGVGRVVPRVWGYSYDPPTGAVLTLWGAESIPPTSLAVTDGSLPNENLGISCAVGRGLAEARFLGPGDRFPFKSADGQLFAPRITGIFTAASALLTNDMVAMPSSDLRRVLGIRPQECTDLAVEVYNPAEVNTVARKIQTAWPDVRLVTRNQILQTYDAVFDWRGGIWLTILLILVAAFFVLVWDKATGLSTEETQFIGVLKAIGWTSRDVLELKLWEGTVISTASVLTGLLLAEIHIVLFGGALFGGLLKGWSVLFPPFQISPGIDAFTVLMILPLTVLPYVAATLVPAWRAAVTEPDSVLRG